MDTPRIITTHQRGEAAPNVWDDFDWVRQHREELFEQYGACVILVYQREVVGVGQTIGAAEEDAEHRLSPDVEQITPITYFLGHPYRIRQAVRLPESTER
jgi:hypothetical protein